MQSEEEIPVIPDQNMLQDLLARRAQEKQRRGLPVGPMSNEAFGRIPMGEDQLPEGYRMVGTAQGAIANAKYKVGEEVQNGTGMPSSNESIDSKQQADQSAQQFAAPPNEVNPHAAKTMLKYGAVMQYLDRVRNL